MQVKNDACIRFLRPSEKAFIVFFDETESAKDNVGLIRAQVFADVLEKGENRLAREINLGDHFRAFFLTPEPLVQRLVVIVDVNAELMRIRPIELSRR